MKPSKTMIGPKSALKRVYDSTKIKNSLKINKRNGFW
jgi:hypothetical protein